MNEQQVCKYYRNGACIAQGELKVACWVPAIKKCRFRENPKFDKITELQHTVLRLLKFIQYNMIIDCVGMKNGMPILIRLKENTHGIGEWIKEEIESLKEKMWAVREE